MQESIAIVGMACRFPGAKSISEYWQNLIAGVESITSFSDEELLQAGIDPELVVQPGYVKASPILEDVYGFDAKFFGLAPNEAKTMDPQHRIMLQTAWEAFEDAGYAPPEIRQVVGVFAGSGGVVSSYLAANLHQYPEFIGSTGSLAHIGNDKDFLSTRLSFKLNFTGPSVNVQTACSTSMVAVHLAGRSLVGRECDLAVAGVAAIRFPHIQGYAVQKGDILSPDGHCRAFDAAAEGTIFGSGVGALVLKRLSDAMADGDRIYAVIRSTAINNDGAEKISYTASNAGSQAAAMVEAMTLASVDADAIGYVECHGTGTAVGDPLEIIALTRAFQAKGWTGGRSCKIGSVKTNIGHLEQAAGIASLIKTALVVTHGKIPPLLNFKEPNPAIDFENGPFEIAKELTDWNGDRPRTALVNCLGLGGTNACCIVEESPRLPLVKTKVRAAEQHVFCVAGKTPEVVDRQIQRMATALREKKTELEIQDACFTANAGRAHFSYRQAVVGRSLEELGSNLEAARGGAVTAAGRPFTVFLFPGQGSHYFRAGKNLYESYEPFRSALDACAERIRDELEVPILNILFKEGQKKLLHDTLYAQPLLFAVEYAISKTWESWNVCPDAVIGHSIGEISAACYAGAMSLDEAVKLVCKRARLMSGIRRDGAMAAVFASADAVESYLSGFESQISIAAINSPSNTVISGDRKVLGEVLERLTSEKIVHKELRTAQAFHSPLLDPVLDEFQSYVEQFSFQKLRIELISNVTAEPLETPSGQYWRDHARKPVRYMEGVQRLFRAGASVFLEVGAGMTLLTLARQCHPEWGGIWLSTLEQGRADWETITGSLRQLYLTGHFIDWNAIYTPWSPKRVSLPTYPFETKSYCLDSRQPVAAKPESGGENYDLPLLGRRIRTSLKQAIYQADYAIARLPFLDDHRIYGLRVLPTTAALDAAACCAREISTPGFSKDDVLEISSVIYWEPLIVPEQAALTVQTIAAPDEGRWSFELLSDLGPLQQGWRRHVTGQMKARPASESHPGAFDPALRERCNREVNVGEYYSAIRSIGLIYGPAFRGINAIYLGRSETLTRVVLPDDVESEPHILHPALVDAGLHIYSALTDEFQAAFADGEAAELRTFLPTGVERFRVFHSGVRTAWVHAIRVTGGETSSETMVVNVFLYDDNGRPIADLWNLSLRRMSPEIFHPDATNPTRDWIYELAWRDAPSEAPDEVAEGLQQSNWVLFSDRHGVASALRRRLEAAGATCWSVYLDALSDSATERSTVLNSAAVSQWAKVLTEFFQKAANWRVVFLWGLDAELPQEPLPAVPDQGLYHYALEILRAVSQLRAKGTAGAKLWIVTRSAQTVGPEPISVNVSQSALWGMGRTFAWEVPQCWGGLVDLDVDDDASQSADGILWEITNGESSDQRAIRGKKRFVARLIRSKPEIGDSKLPELRFDKQAAYLVTGGLGSLGVRVAKWLAQRGAGHIILTSRHGREGREEIIAGLEAQGITLTVAQADAADAGAMGRVFESTDALGMPLRGVVHCAGVLDDGVIDQMDWQKFKRVTDPKIAGGWILHELSQRYELTHFILFSSILSLMGSAGQVNYTAGNAFLDGLAEYRWSRKLPCQVINWGPWDEGGLATAAGDIGRSIWRARGIGYIPPDGGMKVLDYLVRAEKPAAAVMIADWTRFLRQFPVIPDLFLELARGIGADKPGKQTSHLELQRRLQEAAPAERREMLAAVIASEVANVLGIDGKVDLDQSTADLGMDSLISVNLLNRLERVLGQSVPIATLIRGPSVLELVDQLYPEVGLGPEQPKQPEKPADRARPSNLGQWLVPLPRKVAAPVRLICFPFAGGGSAAFRRWEGLLDPSIELIVVEAPGRLRRIEEPPINNISRWTEEAIEAVASAGDKPFAVFGHCLGGITLYEFATGLTKRFGVRPTHVFISGSRPPHLVGSIGDFEKRLADDLLSSSQFDSLKPLHKQNDEIFALALRHFDIPETEKLLSEPDLRAALLPAIRAEFEMISNYHAPVAFERWNLPFICLAGEHDSYVSRDQMLEWNRYTRSSFHLHVRPGAHFLMAEDPEFVVQTINRELCPK